MMTRMGFPSHHLHIIWMIVVFFPVHMMRDFIGAKWPPDFLFGN